MIVVNIIVQGFIQISDPQGGYSPLPGFNATPMETMQKLNCCGVLDVHKIYITRNITLGLEHYT